MWDEQDDAKMCRRYLGPTPGENADLILASMSNVDLGSKKGIRMVKTFLQSKDPGWRILGKKLKDFPVK